MCVKIVKSDKGVCVKMGEQILSVTPKTIEKFFEQNLLGKA